MSDPNQHLVNAHALQLGDRINTNGFGGEILSAAPLAIRIGRTGVAVLFRYGVVVLIDLSPRQEVEFIEKLMGRVSGKFEQYEEEIATIRTR